LDAPDVVDLAGAEVLSHGDKSHDNEVEGAGKRFSFISSKVRAPRLMKVPKENIKGEVLGKEGGTVNHYLPSMRCFADRAESSRDAEFTVQQFSHLWDNRTIETGTRKSHLSDELDWEIKADQQPKPEDVAFDLEETLSSVVALHARIPEDAFTASVLGTERGGNGVVIRDDGLVLTIGYLVTEAEEVWLTTEEGQAVAAHVVGYDQASGFGLVQALGSLGLPAMALGQSRDLAEGAPVIVAGNGGRRRSVCAKVISKREFAGYWEYVLDEGIFTTPPHPNWGGAALVGDDGKLYGIGSLFIQQAHSGEAPVDGNMIVPIDLLVPVFEDMLMFGRPNRPPHPWLGMYVAEAGRELIIAGLAKDGPADQAGLEVGDRIAGVAGEPPISLADLFRRIWALGEAGVEVPLSVMRDGKAIHVSARSAARSDYLKSPRLH